MEDKEDHTVTEEDMGFLICAVTRFRLVLKINSLTDVIFI